MFKILGIMCILAGCLGWGISRIGEERGRVRNLRELISIITRIRDEIAYGKHTMPEICLILAQCCSPPYRDCFRKIYDQVEEGRGAPFDQIWKRQTDECLRGVPLTEEEKDVLKEIPQSLGMQEERLQAESVERLAGLLVRHCRKAEEAYENKSKVILSVSVLTGIFITILLI